MINHLDCQPADQQAALPITCEAAFGTAATAQRRPQTGGARSSGAAVQDQPQLSGNTEFRRRMTDLCPCGQRHFWGGPVCADCFATAPEQIRQEYLAGTPARRDVAIQWLSGLAVMRATSGAGTHVV